MREHKLGKLCQMSNILQWYSIDLSNPWYGSVLLNNNNSHSCQIDKLFVFNMSLHLNSIFHRLNNSNLTMLTNWRMTKVISFFICRRLHFHIEISNSIQTQLSVSGWWYRVSNIPCRDSYREYQWWQRLREEEKHCCWMLGSWTWCPGHLEWLCLSEDCWSRGSHAWQ